MTEASTGPILLARGADKDSTSLAALLVTSPGIEPPLLSPQDGAPVTPLALDGGPAGTVWRYDFELPAATPAHYRLGGESYPVATSWDSGAHIAFVSCNGQEHGDFERPEPERNAVWNRLRQEQEERPFQLLLHGGDQLYADPVWRCHPELVAWWQAGRGERRRQPFSAEARAAAARFYLDHHRRVYSQPATAHLLARVPSLMIWDDHDIFDGWGSHPAWFLDSPVAAGLFEEARSAFCLLQLGVAPTEPPAGALDGSGSSLGWRCRMPGFTVVAPDLRSERRPERVMGAAGWAGFRQALDEEPEGARILLLSSVPALGPRLSWIEACIGIVPRLRRYEDDLRDQWQSRHHRQEWIDLLTCLERHVEERGQHITLLSGEIHLATRAELKLASGPLHQLVASGIAHPAPPTAYAAGLGLLARLGESPLPGRPISLHPLPGRSGIYTADRNFLALDGRDGNWQARWYLERDGWTPPLSI